MLRYGENEEKVKHGEKKTEQGKKWCTMKESQVNVKIGRDREECNEVKHGKRSKWRVERRKKDGKKL